MEELKKKSGTDTNDKEIVFSQAIKAGKRIYYVDVKKNRKDEMFLAITESKKIVTGGDPNDPQVTFEKHKIFLYKEDFDKFMNGLQQAIRFIQAQQQDALETPAPVHATGEKEGEQSSSLEGDIKIDIDF